MLSEYTTPGVSIELDDNQTIYSLLTRRIERTGTDTVIAAKKLGPGRWQDITAGEFHASVVSAAKGLIALGIAKGDAVTLFSSTRLEWGVLDFALAAVGAVSVPIYDTDSASQAQRIMNDSAVKLAIADNRERYDRLDSIKDNCRCPTRSLPNVSPRCMSTIWRPSCTPPAPPACQKALSSRTATS